MQQPEDSETFNQVKKSIGNIDYSNLPTKLNNSCIKLVICPEQVWMKPQEIEVVYKYEKEYDGWCQVGAKISTIYLKDELKDMVQDEHSIKIFIRVNKKYKEIWKAHNYDELLTLMSKN